MVRKEYTGRDNLDVMVGAKNYNEFLLDLVISAANKSSSIVDFGAGGGTFCLPLASSGYHVTCVETDALLSRKLSRNGLQVWDDLSEVKDASLDYIYSLNVLEHIDADEAVIDLWFSKLRPGGNLLVYVPAFQVLFSSMDRKVSHFRRYRKHDLSEKLRNAGFELRSTRYADSLGFFATLAYKVIGSDIRDINPGMLRIYDTWFFPASRVLDRLVGGLFGKNVYALANKPESLRK